MAIKLGTTVADKITGFIGVAVSRMECLNGCIRIGVQARSKDNMPGVLEYFDEQSVDASSMADTGGVADPPRARF
jgi:hypothetical protein